MCHVSLLNSDQIAALEALPLRFQKRFETLTDKVSVRNRARTVEAFETVMSEAGKSAERVMEKRVDLPKAVPLTAEREPIRA